MPKGKGGCEAAGDNPKVSRRKGGAIRGRRRRSFRGTLLYDVVP